MTEIIYQHDEFAEFEKLAAPWNVEERLRREVQPSWSSALGASNGFSLKSFLGFTHVADYDQALLDRLRSIWVEIESHRYSKSLLERLDYRNASKGFERKKVKRIADEKTQIRERIQFRYLTAFHINILGRLPRPVRLVPDKETAERVSKRVGALLEDMERPDEFAEWADYKLRAMLRDLKRKMDASSAMQRVPNTLSPENYFVFHLAQRFVDHFDEPMPAVLGDLCRVIGASPDDSTINRWVAQALQHRSDRLAEKEKRAT